KLDAPGRARGADGRRGLHDGLGLRREVPFGLGAAQVGGERSGTPCSAAHGPRNRRSHLAGAALDLKPARDPRLLLLALALALLEEPLGQLARSVRRAGLEGEAQEVVVHLARPLVAVV